jgi:acyl-CoA dehydrogenase
MTTEQQAIRDAILTLLNPAGALGDDYWLARDRDGAFPHAFFDAFAAGGWLGIAMPQEYGGAGLGIQEAAILMQAIAESGAGMAGASAVHLNIFGLNPVVVFGTGEQKARWLPPMIRGEVKACFAVTEPNTGLNTLKLQTRAERRDGAYVLTGQKVWTSTAQVATKMLILARTTPAEAVSRPPKGSASSIPIWTGATWRCARSTRWAARRSIPISSSSTACPWQPRTASARKAAASSTCCTVSIPSGS